MERVMHHFVGSSEGILFEITLCADAVATAIGHYSVHSHEHEVLIAAMSGFIVDSIDYIPAPQSDQRVTTTGSDKSTIPKVTLRYWLSWFDSDIDNRPPTVIV
jgi:hypothetical protein